MLTVSNNWPATFSAIGQLFYLVLLSGIVIAMAYVCVRFVGKARFPVGRRHMNLRLLESIPLGINCSIQLIKVGEKYILVSVTKDKISFLTEIDKEHIDINLEEYTEQKLDVPFEKYLRKFIHQTRDKDQSHDEKD